MSVVWWDVDKCKDTGRDRRSRQWARLGCGGADRMAGKGLYVGRVMVMGKRRGK